MDYYIVNIVANTEINQKLDLNKLNHELIDSEYEPDIYFALIYRLTDPKLSILINHSGKIIFTGAKSIKDIENARNKFYNDLVLLGYQPEKNEIIVTNIVAIINIGEKINIDRISQYLDVVEYNPESYPAVIFRNNNPKFTSQLFRNGKITIVGLKKIEHIKIAIKLIKKLLD
jgi:transcription initiation factor TFIID TATA-box-binding protein